MIDLARRLTPHFTLGELLRSATAERIPALREQQMNPPPAVIANLEHLAARTLEPARQTLSLALLVTSGYRCPAVNRRVGGARTSQHLRGQAADLHLIAHDGSLAALHAEITAAARHHTGRPLRPNISADYLLFAWLALHLADLDIDQLIHEYGQGPGNPAWVHVSASPGPTARHQILLIDHHHTRPLDLLAALDLQDFPVVAKSPRLLTPGSLLQRALPCRSSRSRRSTPTVDSRNRGLESCKRLRDRSLMRFKRFSLCNWQDLSFSTGPTGRESPAQG